MSDQESKCCEDVLQDLDALELTEEEADYDAEETNAKEQK
jgi:hypothetical protein